ncbi:hypothetical protein BH11PAT2_BH11PAT2_01380 [soil metagenome]
MQKVIFITGMPGSGKTTYLNNHTAEFSDALICDDYYKSALDADRPRKFVGFKGSAYYEDVKEALANGRDVVMADIVFYEDELGREAREGLEALIAELGTRVDIDYRYFENDAEACIANIVRRDRPERVESELKFVTENRDSYRIPKNATVLPVYREV